MKNYFDLTGRVAVITGASSGLGVQMAKALANQGADIAILARRKEKLEQAAKEIAALGVKCIPVKCDITDTAQIEEAKKEILAKLGRIDILVNSAGTGGVAPTVDVSDEMLMNEINIDLVGTFKMARAVAPEMIKQGFGRIINIASMYGLVGNMIAPSAAYHAAKGGVVNLTRALAAEWGKDGITVNSICPGYFVTELTESTLKTEQFAAYAKGAIPVGRYGDEGELDSTVIYLASPASNFVTGMNIAVDGGYTCI
ncbi:MAG TPA: SDR family oxidoreductase [Methanocorpusculum sp.]|jgi:NAD(P)-dependent dehydrogenase (short-subunit alcohol dehydrogenase family)|uniref:Short-chain dehydrogenase n=1 Tax=Methanocorpusculum parvum TaxID=2193 RepID=A0AAX0Q9I8_9EURY|nr:MULTISPECIES: SDR family oxidoreductase [Methanocorpusculum]MDY3203285.1 SDR family oxidoreductase [Methanocorpusculum sp.]NLC91548.1 SDR family oxidoreductase [Methanocorpusculum parvum]PAV09931.1 short-chain dehydrogenase [Methanocorpusculum parvum]HJJ35202.1 SDR family oxidoreductase [Methanocorpusculum sp.]HJJ38269.1 SDR family oxidoreductase [Methanocorpusculum sp.]